MQFVSIILLIMVIIIWLLPEEEEIDYKQLKFDLLKCPNRHDWIKKDNNFGGNYIVCSKCKYLPESDEFEP